MIRLGKAIFLFFSICLGANAFSQRGAGPPYGTNWVNVDKVRCRVSVSNVTGQPAITPLMNISGTKCEFLVNASPPQNPDYAGGNPDPYTVGQVIEWHLYFSVGKTTEEIPGLPALVNLTDYPNGVRIRIASNHFADGSTVTIKLSAVFKVGKVVGNVLVWSPQTVPVDVNPQVIIYNKSTSVTTQEVFVPATPTQPGYYTVPTNPGPNSVPEIARRAGNYADAWFPTIKHTNLNAVGHHDMRKANVYPQLKDTTVFFACTHGDLSVLRACFTDEMPYWTPNIENPDDIFTQVRNGRTNPQLGPPGLNMALLFACEAPGTDAATAFGLGTNNLIYLDRALVYFPKTLWAFQYNRSNQMKGVDLYVNDFLNCLAAGDTVSMANDRLTRQEYKWSFNMSIIGDRAANINNVYTGKKLDRSSTWYLVLP